MRRAHGLPARLVLHLARACPRRPTRLYGTWFAPHAPKSPLHAWSWACTPQKGHAHTQRPLPRFGGRPLIQAPGPQGAAKACVSTLPLFRTKHGDDWPVFACHIFGEGLRTVVACSSACPTSKDGRRRGVLRRRSRDEPRTLRCGTLFHPGDTSAKWKASPRCPSVT